MERPSYQAAHDAVRTLIAWTGDNPDRPGVWDTPARVLRAWDRDWGAGSLADSPPEITLFHDVVDPHFDGPMIRVDGLTFFSHCEHHMTPFYGTASIAYIPLNGGVLGLSKFARVLDHFARRLHVQERLTQQVADYLACFLANDVAVTLRATHMCMVSRGVRQPNALTTTTALRGAFYNDPATRAEYLAQAVPHA